MLKANRKEACKTYLEQTKLLVTLTSAFIIAPIALFENFRTSNGIIITMEICFVLSVFLGYVVFGTIAGTQHNGKFNVYNKNTTLFSRLQIALFFIGLIFLLVNLSQTDELNSSSNTDAKKSASKTALVNYNDKSVYFDFDQSFLRPESYHILDSLINFLTKENNYKIKIAAHTDSIGSKSYNKKLSEFRALAIKNYFLSKGVMDNRILTSFHWDSLPKTRNSSYFGRLLNRRAELSIIPLEIEIGTTTITE